jgi:hypothetical protein
MKNGIREAGQVAKVITLTDEQYRTIEDAAQARGLAPDALLALVIDEMRDPRVQPRYFETDEWLRHLGMSDETLRDITTAIKVEVECPHDADA